ncbi:hypothetical protein AALP_AA7G034100 [Arabis alpina]|uniref:EIF3d n=1 Tax=Arabis alpina TaxID=50452 RepID=A0A087GFP1_ARAAL|nr:hypothetical protein AALP_AA7G034100 [Arabis alpina]
MVLKDFESISVPSNPDGWGPPPTSPSSAAITAIATANLPYSSFSPSQKLGRIANWTLPKPNPSPLFDFSSFNINDDRFRFESDLTPSSSSDESAFHLIDSKPPPQPKPRYSKRNRIQLPQRRDAEIESNSNRRHLNRNHHRRESAVFKSSVDIKPDWILISQIQFSTLTKLSLSVQEPEDLLLCGSLAQYNRVYDRVTVNKERKLERFENKNFVKVTSTSDDTVIRSFAKEDKTTVFATDSVLATLMCATRSVYSWDIVVQRVGNKLFLDKRDGLDLLSVHEASQESLPEAKDDINSAYSLGVEAGRINQSFSRQVLVKDDEANDDVSVAYRLFLTLNALNEFDTKYSGVDWRQKLETQRGTVLGNELKNNGNKLAKWTVQALLANADLMKIGFVSRVHPRDHNNHVILSVLGYKPKDFAGQISLNSLNMWGIVKSIVDLCMTLSEGKYVLVKDPSKPQVMIYEVPSDAFENEYVENPSEEKRAEASVETGDNKRADDV